MPRFSNWPFVFCNENLKFFFMPTHHVYHPNNMNSKACVCGRLVAGIVGSNPAGDMMSVSCNCCVLLGRGLCVGLITRLEESYRV
jgi:hypothetical protein